MVFFAAVQLVPAADIHDSQFLQCKLNVDAGSSGGIFVI